MARWCCSTYVIDHKGVIRHKWVGSPGEKAIDAALDKLIRLAPIRVPTPLPDISVHVIQPKSIRPLLTDGMGLGSVRPRRPNRGAGRRGKSRTSIPRPVGSPVFTPW